ncbi:MAG: ATP-binding cassette domain-containing protein [Pseudomonadota bacterium]|nr:ATP-binding cassette domain-containing protein [Pseudomonadota bacterium]
MTSPTIELQNVRMIFDNHTLFTKVNIAVGKGETLVLIGPSGHGKTVLLKIMCGLIRPSQGDVSVEGHDFLNITESKKQRLLCKMGVLFQKNALFDSLCVTDNIAFPLRETTTKSEVEILEICSRFLSSVGILDAKDLFPDEISGGMQKRLGIARALALEPKIVFYDDPTAGLDPITSRQIIQLILELKKTYGSTVVAITNDMNRAYQMADKIAMIIDGEVILTGTPQETKFHSDPRVQQFIRGEIKRPPIRDAND